VEQKDSSKYLGIIVDEKFSFSEVSEHINEKISEAYAVIGIIQRNLKYLNSNSFVLLYKSMVRSHECGQDINGAMTMTMTEDRDKWRTFVAGHDGPC